MAKKIMLGKELADNICKDLAQRAESLAEHGARPRLSILRVGERKDDVSYEMAAIRRCDTVGIRVENISMSDDIAEEELLSIIDELNTNERVSGIMLFRPLPEHMNEQRICAAIAPAKDVDGVTPHSMAAVYSGNGAGFTPCAAQACMELLKMYDIPTAGKRAVVVGRSLVCGKPTAMLLLKGDATVTLCHTKTERLDEITRSADIVLTAAGEKCSFGAEYFSPGQTVVDVGMVWDEESQRLCGDVDYEAVKDIVDAISPVPSGVGAVTASILALHVIEAAERAMK